MVTGHAKHPHTGAVIVLIILDSGGGSLPCSDLHPLAQGLTGSEPIPILVTPLLTPTSSLGVIGPFRGLNHETGPWIHHYLSLLIDSEVSISVSTFVISLGTGHYPSCHGALLPANISLLCS
jgi:hypothetical protein